VKTQHLLDNFNLIAEAPEGVVKLRELILQLAIRGQIVPQRLDEGQASIGVPITAPEEGWPFSIPSTWCWAMLGNVVDYNYGEKTDSLRIPGDAWVLDLEDIEKDTSKLLRRVLARDRQSTSTKSRFAEGDVLYGKLRPYLNKALIADADGFCTTEIVPMRPANGVISRYVLCVLKSRYFLDYTGACAYGVKMPRLGTADAKKALFPLPPIAEQKRIVAEVSKLATLCDVLETKLVQSREEATKLTSAIVNHIYNAHTDSEGENK